MKVSLLLGAFLAEHGFAFFVEPASKSGPPAAFSFASRRSWLEKAASGGLGLATVATTSPAWAKQGEYAKMGQPPEGANDGALGGRADSWGDKSRENGLYAQQVP